LPLQNLKNNLIETCAMNGNFHQDQSHSAFCVSMATEKITESSPWIIHMRLIQIFKKNSFWSQAIVSLTKM